MLMIKKSHRSCCESNLVWDAWEMGLTHCPLCIGLAILSAVRFLAHCVLAVQIERARASESVHPAMLLGTLFELS